MLGLGFFAEVVAGWGELTEMIFITSVPVETTRACVMVVGPGPSHAADLSGKTARHLCCRLNGAANNTTKQDCSPASGQWLCLSSSSGLMSVDFTVLPSLLGRVAISLFRASPRKGCSATPVQEGESEKV